MEKAGFFGGKPWFFGGYFWSFPLLFASQALILAATKVNGAKKVCRSKFPKKPLFATLTPIPQKVKRRYLGPFETY